MKYFIETERVILTPPHLDNFEVVSKLFADAEVMRYVGYGPRTPEVSLIAMQSMVKHYEKHGFSVCDAYEKSSGLFMGRAGLIYLELDDSQPEIEIGYVLHKEFWGKGYATELASAIISWGFENLDVKKLIGVIRPSNHASRHVLQKVKMKYVENKISYGSDAEFYEIWRE